MTDESKLPISPKKLIGKDVYTVVERMKVHELTYRVVRKNGLITADYDPMRYSIMVDENDIIIDCVIG